MNETLIEISTTCGNKGEAHKIARLAVEKKLCACVHIEEIESFYTWQNNVQNEVEYKLTFKSISTRYYDIEALIKENHSYELPAIYATPVSICSSDYENWIIENSTQSTS